MAETIRFQIGRPETVALKFGDGKVVAGKYGQQMMYSTTDGRAFYLDPDPAHDVEQELADLGIRVGQPFLLTKVKTPYGKHEYRVERAGDAGGHNRPDRLIGQGTQTLQASAPRTVTTFEQFEQQQEQHHAIAAPPTATPTASRMMSCFLSAIDAISEAQAYATRKGLGITFTSEDIRAAALTCYISACKEGR